MHSSGACGLRSPPSCALSLMPRMCAQRPSEVCTFPSASDLGSRRLELLLQENSPNCPQVSFSENPPAQSCSSIQGRACPLTQPTSPARPGTVWVRDPTRPNSQLSPAGYPQSPCVYHTLSLFPSLRLQATRSLWVLLKPCLAGEGALTWLSPRSPAVGPVGMGLGLQLPWSPRRSQGPFCPEAIPLPSVFSVSSILFGLLFS